MPSEMQLSPEEAYKEALKRIKHATQDGLRELRLRKLGLTELPPEIGDLTNLTTLRLDGNKLTEVPSEIGRLINLTTLRLENNRLAKFPPEIGELTNLTTLSLMGNKLANLPPEIGKLINLVALFLTSNRLTELPPDIEKLTNLELLYLVDNQFTELPPEIGKLNKLIELLLNSNRLTELPPEIGKLTNLKELDLNGNQLTELPPEIGKLTNLTEFSLYENRLTELPPGMGQITNLRRLFLHGNPFKSPPPEIVAQGPPAILAYLRERLEAGKRQWISKMLVVGEGGVGKTSLLRALRGKKFKSDLATTHGIEIDSLNIEHPTEPGVTMELNCWDFGGQEIYHATHQFFLTDRSLFVLVWNARHGFGQGKLRYWLDAIQSRAPKSPVLIVAAWTDERDADLPLAELREEYPQIVGHYEISNKTGEGVEALRTALADTAKDLPLMGETWPADWLKAAEALRTMEEKHISPAAMQKIMSKHKVKKKNHSILGRWLHELGDILHFQDDELLDDIVILKPQWVTKYISKVLESKKVINKEGVFTSNHMRKLWKQVDKDMQDHFLRLMERFDLSYRTLEDSEISLVVERLPLDTPDYSNIWDGIKEKAGCREVSLKYALSTIPAGIPTWFIARSHRFTTHTHWRNGAVFADSKEQKHLALVQARPHDKYIQLSVRGPTPSNFLALMRDGIEVTLNRFSGLEIDRTIPCLGHNSEPCRHEFKYEDLQRRLERNPPRLEIECPVAIEDVSVMEMLFGLDIRTQGDVLERMEDLLKDVAKKQDQALLELKELSELSRREFLAIYQREQSKIESHCPNIFVLRPRGTAKWKKALVGQKIELQLYCQAAEGWHPTQDSGLYAIDDPAKWIKTTAPHIAKMVKYLKYVAPVAEPWVSVAIPEYEKLLKNDIKLMTELMKVIPEMEEDPATKLADAAGRVADPERITGASLRAIRQLLDEKDKQQKWGGLKKILTPEGHYLWLCDHHAEEYKI